MGKRQGIEGLPDTYISWLGTGAQVAQNEEEAEKLYRALPRGSEADRQRLVAERERKTGRDEEDE